MKQRINNIRHFIKAPKAGDIIRVYLEDGEIKHAVAVGLIKRKGDRQRVKARLIDPMTQIRNIVEQVFETDLSTRNRNERRVLARKAYCYLMRRYTDRSLTEIGDSIGLNHSTVIHHSKHPSLGAEATARLDRYFKDLLNECEKQINDLVEDKPPFKVLLQQRLDDLQIGEVVQIIKTENGFEFC